MSSLRLVPADALRIQAWANGAGTTTVIDSGPDEAHWAWRLSIADIAQDCDFSSFPGTRRHFVPLDAPLRLRFDAGRELSLLRLSVTCFDGAQAPHALLLDGPTRAFNLMLRGAAEGTLLARPLNGHMSLPLRAASRWFVHLLGGHAHVQADEQRMALTAGSNLWIDATHGGMARIEGGGELVLVQLAA
ncbi:HutD family protein [Dyella jejuensis]|uniref:HutD family protein n=1 Tax=Dyella jejuensis TaxID=1432009 RepID=A0ABW8JH59_9GAMM